MNKKASARDVVVFGIILFIMGIGLFIANFAINTTIDGMLQADQLNSSNYTRNALLDTQEVVNRFDYVVAGIFIALVLGVWITGWLIGGMPIFMAVYFLVNVIAVIVSAILANFWDDLSTASVFGTTLSLFPITNHLLSNLHIYVAIVGLIGLLVMFGKPYFEEAGGI